MPPGVMSCLLCRLLCSVARRVRPRALCPGCAGANAVSRSRPWRRVARGRYAVGILLQQPSAAEDAALAAAGYARATLQRTRCAASSFPFTGLVSILLGLMRVYPLLGKACQEQGLAEDAIGPFFEVGTGRCKEMLYYAPLEKQDHFLLGLESPLAYAAANPK